LYNNVVLKCGNYISEKILPQETKTPSAREKKKEAEKLVMYLLYTVRDAILKYLGSDFIRIKITV